MGRTTADAIIRNSLGSLIAGMVVASMLSAAALHARPLISPMTPPQRAITTPTPPDSSPVTTAPDSTIVAHAPDAMPAPVVLPQSGVTLLTGITVTDAQQQQLDKIRDQSSAKFDAFATATNAVLAAENRPMNPAERAAADQLGKDDLDAILAVLTSVQQQQLAKNLQAMAAEADAWDKAVQAAHATQIDNGLRFVPQPEPPAQMLVPDPQKP